MWGLFMDFLKKKFILDFLCIFLTKSLIINSNSLNLPVPPLPFTIQAGIPLPDAVRQL